MILSISYQFISTKWISIIIIHAKTQNFLPIFFSILICDGMKISVAIIKFNSFFLLFGGLLNKIAVYTECNLLIQGIQILTNIVGKTGTNGNPVVQKGH